MKRNVWMAAALATVLMAACSDDSENDNPALPEPDGGGQVEVTTVSGNVSGVWKKNTVVQVDGHLRVPAGSSLTIEEGVQVIFTDKGVGVNHVPVEFTVDGNLYLRGTAENPVLLSVAEEKRTAANAFAGLWGGIVATSSCEELLIDHAVIEYTGGQVIEGSPAATAEIYTAGDDAYPQVTTCNLNGRYVITHSILRNGWSDAVYMMGGKAIIAENLFVANGFDGAEVVNVKAGCQADVAGNIMFSPNTNGLKLSSSGQSEERGQARVQAYNNTIINAGWRRDGEKGGCVYAEKNVLANVFNNLMVNCKFRAQTPSYKNPNNPEEGYDNTSVIDYNYYASGSQRSDIVFADASGVAYAWEGYNYAHKNYYEGVVDAHSVIATEQDGKDPLFENFSIHAVPLTSYSYDEAWDFHLKAGSPALTGANSGSAASLKPYFAGGLSVGGTTYSSPAVAAHYGALGTK